MTTATDSRLLPLPTPVRDWGLLVTRVVLGVVLVAHGWQKFTEWGIAGTTASFQEMGVPAPPVSALIASIVELGGGILLILGLFTTVAGILAALTMLGAVLFVHAPHGVFVAGNGWELVAVIGLASLVFALVGPGRLSLDTVIAGRRTATLTP
ncbi:DoxX family protein [Citricoccus sp. K5]|uniref:DoxX family protein n=1 Tax=Citricoccus sp. K5 TaxID=2653135 RepID=UPI0012F18238|nr:DoxX family protein [Citricoccus sp. K5]VXB99399.1 putative oxidoreductase MhqP [Citricoccus sp. K5]